MPRSGRQEAGELGAGRGGGLPYGLGHGLQPCRSDANAERMGNPCGQTKTLAEGCPGGPQSVS